MARNDREVQALTGDKHAWVGLPIGIETYEEYRLKKKEAEPENVVRLKSKSPYNAPVVNWKKFDSAAKNSKKKRKEQIARMSEHSGSGSGSGTESSGQENDSASEDENKDGNDEVDIYKPMNEKKFVKKLEKYGYDSATMDPFESSGVARLGTYSYDAHTGRRILHKGNNR